MLRQCSKALSRKLVQSSSNNNYGMIKKVIASSSAKNDLFGKYSMGSLMIFQNEMASKMMMRGYQFNTKEFTVGGNISTHGAIPGLQISNSESYSERLRTTLLSPIVIVPHAEQWVVERFGRYCKTLDSGIHFLIPLLDTIAYKHTTKEIILEVNKQTAITKDNVQLNLDGVLYTRITDAYKASYEIEKPFVAIMNLAQTTMRSEIGKITLDNTFAERQHLNEKIVQGIEKIASGWGISIQRYEIRDIQVPTQIKQAMDLEAEAERKKRKTVLDSLAEKEAQENVAKGRKTAVELVSEANMIEEINLAKGKAFAVKAAAEAYAEAIERLASAISHENGEKAVALKIAENYIEQFGRLAKTGNTVIIPSNVSDVSSQVTQAITIFDKIFNQSNKKLDISKEEALLRLKEMSGIQEPTEVKATEKPATTPSASTVKK
ncbi:hypothetical protein C9374_003186 [Naegleria lovaniensis]|uniref:Band 7 domain-containing protein n=1 Tax=Naegleria lovaniensis TaxID=51637 RepID=A0AA88KQ45_NAELO|nr:uncharacterized protein C9374_003186 [Naegleria lovaniensis]KAG2386037.1 hypothetical protein C9374_003186 [Naegleria lovaniensis]